MARRPASEQFDGLKEVRSAAFHLFGRYGYDGVSIDAIAKAAGTSKSALYWHFKNKQALFLDCLEQLHRIFQTTVFDPMAKADDPASAMILFFRQAIVLLKDPRIEEGIAGYWLEAGSIHPEEVQQAHQQFNQHITRTLEKVLEQGQAQGIFNLTEPLDKLARTIINTLEALMLPMRGQTLSEKQELVGILAGIMFRAYLPSHELADQAVKLIYENIEEKS